MLYLEQGRLKCLSGSNDLTEALFKLCPDLLNVVAQLSKLNSTVCEESPIQLSAVEKGEVFSALLSSPGAPKFNVSQQQIPACVASLWPKYVSQNHKLMLLDMITTLNILSLKNPLFQDRPRQICRRFKTETARI